MFQGGLGNQLFEYVYYKYLMSKFPNEKIYGFYYSRWLKAHNGLEISKWFDVTLPPSTSFTHSVAFLLFIFARLFYKLGIRPPFINYKFERNDSAFFQEGFWQDKEFIEEVGMPEIKHNIELDEYNTGLLKMIISGNSISIHVRRGDYLTPENKAIFGNICTTDYYKECIEKAKQSFENPVFLIFSNDIEYSKTLFAPEDKCVFVDGNQGEKSFFDLYLMAHCKGMILANSTFSCWAAYLNKRAQMVMSPSRWVNKGIEPNVNLGTWTCVEIPQLN